MCRRSRLAHILDWLYIRFSLCLSFLTDVVFVISCLPPPLSLSLSLSLSLCISLRQIICTSSLFRSRGAPVAKQRQVRRHCPPVEPYTPQAGAKWAGGCSDNDDTGLGGDRLAAPQNTGVSCGGNIVIFCLKSIIMICIFLADVRCYLLLVVLFVSFVSLSA